MTQTPRETAVATSGAVDSAGPRNVTHAAPRIKSTQSKSAGWRFIRACAPINLYARSNALADAPLSGSDVGRIWNAGEDPPRDSKCLTAERKAVVCARSCGFSPQESPSRQSVVTTLSSALGKRHAIVISNRTGFLSTPRMSNRSASNVQAPTATFSRNRERRTRP